MVTEPPILMNVGRQETAWLHRVSSRRRRSPPCNGPVTRALDRKRRLGQYAVFRENGRVIFDGPDAPTQQEESAGGSRIGLGSAAPPGTECPQTGTERSRS